MSRLAWYVIRAMLATSLTLLLTLVGLAFLFTLVDELRSGTAMARALWYATLDSPGFVQEMLTVSLLAGCVIALSLLARNHELMIMQAGLGLRRLIGVALIPGLLAAGVALVNAEYILPFAAELEHVQRYPDAATSRHKQWFQVAEQHVFVEHALPNGRLEGLRVYSYDPDSTRLLSIGYAAGAWHQGGQWILTDAQHFEVGTLAVQPTTVHTAWRLPSPAHIGAVRLAPEALSIHLLYEQLRQLDAGGVDHTRYRRIFWSRLLHVVALPLCGLLALALVLGYSLPYATKAGLGALIGISYYAVDHTMYYLGIVHTLEPLLCAATAPALLLTATLLLSYRLRRPGGVVRL